MAQPPTGPYESRPPSRTQRFSTRSPQPTLALGRQHNGNFPSAPLSARQFHRPRYDVIFDPQQSGTFSAIVDIKAARLSFRRLEAPTLSTLPSSETLKTVIRLAVRSQACRCRPSGVIAEYPPPNGYRKNRRASYPGFCTHSISPCGF